MEWCQKKLPTSGLRILQEEFNSVFNGNQIKVDNIFEKETFKNLINFTFRLFEGSIRYLPVSHQTGSIAFAVDSVKNSKEKGVTVPRRLTKTGLSHSQDLIVEYSTIFMEELACAKYLKHQMNAVPSTAKGIKLEDAYFLACLNSTRLDQDYSFQYWEHNDSVSKRADWQKLHRFAIRYNPFRRLKIYKV